MLASMNDVSYITPLKNNNNNNNIFSLMKRLLTALRCTFTIRRIHPPCTTQSITSKRRYHNLA